MLMSLKIPNISMIMNTSDQSMYLKYKRILEECNYYQNISCNNLVNHEKPEKYIVNKGTWNFCTAL